MSPLFGPFHMPIRGARPIAEGLLRANRFSEAEAAFADEAAARPRDPRPLVASGHLALMRNDLALADERLSAAVARDRRMPEANSCWPKSATVGATSRPPRHARRPGATAPIGCQAAFLRATESYTRSTGRRRFACRS